MKGRDVDQEDASSNIATFKKITEISLKPPENIIQAVLIPAHISLVLFSVLFTSSVRPLQPI